MGFVSEQTYSQSGPVGRGQTRGIRQNGDRRIPARRREREKAKAMDTGLEKGGASIGCNPREDQIRAARPLLISTTREVQYETWVESGEIFCSRFGPWQQEMS